MAGDADGAAPPDDIDLIIRGMVGFAKRIRREARLLHSEVSYIDFTLLFVLNETPGLRAVDLAEAVAIDKSTASRQLASLERRGLITRAADPASPRSRSLRLTERAERVLADTDREWRRRIAARTADWPSEDLRVFATLIHRYMTAELPDERSPSGGSDPVVAAGNDPTSE